MPADKIRGIVREYFQIEVLKSLYRNRLGQRLFFMGETALRLVENMPRFSEDLDFNILPTSLAEWRALVEETVRDVSLLGFKLEYSAKEQYTLLMADFKCVNILQHYRSTPLKNEKLRVKLQANCPEWKSQGGAKFLSGFGETFPVRVLDRAQKMSGKIHALLNRERGRDLYDLFFMLGRGFPASGPVLRHYGVTDPRGSLDRRIRGFTDEDLKRLAKQVLPFLFDPRDSWMVTDCKKHLDEWLSKLEVTE